MIVHTDGAARGNPGPAGIGAAMTSADGDTIATVAEGIGIATNNQAEYLATLAGLRLAADHGARRVTVRTDSRLLVEQMNGRFKVKNPTLQRLHQEVRELARGFDRVEYEHVPREENAAADALANEGVDAWLAEQGRSRGQAPPDVYT